MANQTRPMANHTTLWEKPTYNQKTADEYKAKSDDLPSDIRDAINIYTGMVNSVSVATQVSLVSNKVVVVEDKEQVEDKGQVEDKEQVVEPVIIDTKTIDAFWKFIEDHRTGETFNSSFADTILVSSRTGGCDLFGKHIFDLIQQLVRAAGIAGAVMPVETAIEIILHGQEQYDNIVNDIEFLKMATELYDMDLHKNEIGVIRGIVDHYDDDDDDDEEDD
jgi:hypothetical protein